MLTTKAAFKRMREKTMSSMKMRCKKGLHTLAVGTLRIKWGMLMLIKSRQVPRKVIFNKVAYLHKPKGKIMAVPHYLPDSHTMYSGLAFKKAKANLIWPTTCMHEKQIFKRSNIRSE